MLNIRMKTRIKGTAEPTYTMTEISLAMIAVLLITFLTAFVASLSTNQTNDSISLTNEESEQTSSSNDAVSQVEDVYTILIDHSISNSTFKKELNRKGLLSKYLIGSVEDKQAKQAFACDENIAEEYNIEHPVTDGNFVRVPIVALYEEKPTKKFAVQLSKDKQNWQFTNIVCSY